jgi:hypothetical protein
MGAVPTTAGVCALLAVAPQPGSASVELSAGPGAAVTVGSLVRTDPAGTCAVGQKSVRLVSDNRLYPRSLPLPSAGFCVQGARLADPIGLVLMEGEADFDTSRVMVNRGEVQLADCTQLHALMKPAWSPTPVAALLPGWGQAQAYEVGRAYSRAFHQPAPVVVWSHWDRVALPFAHWLDAEELQAEYDREGLVTATQQERATAALGPTLPGQTEPAYTHFTGSDPRGSDIWADAELLLRFFELSAAFRAMAPGREWTIQVGDLAWPSPARPDPLGHKDHKGRCMDVRLFRNDGSRYEAWWNRPDDRPGFATAYEVSRQRLFLGSVTAAWPGGIHYFNDPAVLGLPEVRSWPGHDDHMHICLPS